MAPHGLWIEDPFKEGIASRQPKKGLGPDFDLPTSSTSCNNWPFIIVLVPCEAEKKESLKRDAGSYSMFSNFIPSIFVGRLGPGRNLEPRCRMYCGNRFTASNTEGADAASLSLANRFSHRCSMIAWVILKIPSHFRYGQQQALCNKAPRSVPGPEHWTWETEQRPPNGRGNGGARARDQMIPMRTTSLGLDQVHGDVVLACGFIHTCLI